MDIQLPGMSGIEAMHKLKDNENTKNIPIVAMSANSLKKRYKGRSCRGIR